MTDFSFLANVAFATLITASAFLIASTHALVGGYESEELEYCQLVLRRVVAELKFDPPENIVATLNEKLENFGVKLAARHRSSEYIMRTRFFLYGLMLAAALFAFIGIGIGQWAILNGIDQAQIDVPVRAQFLMSVLITSVVALWSLIAVPFQAEHRRILRELLLWDRLRFSSDGWRKPEGGSPSETNPTGQEKNTK